MDNYDFERVSPTALGPVIGRGEFSDIPFAREILSYLQQRSQPLSTEFVNGIRGHAAFFEARFKAVSQILLEQHATQIFELASGYSPRSLDPAFAATTYVEVDLPKMVQHKRAIVTALLDSIPLHLKFCSASVLNRDELEQGLTPFRHAPVAITSEGLLRYLTFDEKRQLAENVKSILSRYGGVWITPDIHLRKWAPRPPKTQEGGQGQEYDWTFREQLGRDVDPNYFNDLAHAQSFFESCGFDVIDRPLLEGVRERVISLSHATPERLAELEARRIYTMSVRS